MKKVNVSIGDLINVDVCQPKIGKYPIGRHLGMVCKLTLPDSIKRLEYGCTIEARVAIIEPKYLSVMVERVIVSAAANNAIVTSMMTELANKFGHNHLTDKKRISNVKYHELG